MYVYWSWGKIKDMLDKRVFCLIQILVCPLFGDQNIRKVCSKASLLVLVLVFFSHMIKFLCFWLDFYLFSIACHLYLSLWRRQKNCFNLKLKCFAWILPSKSCIHFPNDSLLHTKICCTVNYFASPYNISSPSLCHSSKYGSQIRIRI